MPHRYGVPGLTLLYLFNDLPPTLHFALLNEPITDLHRLLHSQIVGGPSIIFARHHEADVTVLRRAEYGETPRTCRSIVGFDANGLYLWAIMQDMPTGWYTRRRAENTFRLERVHRYGRRAVQWLTWEAEQTGVRIRHQLNGCEQRVGKYRIDCWCPETRTAYQFQGFLFHGCPCTGKETNGVNGKQMRQLYAETLATTTYLRRFVTVVEMW